MYKFPYSFLGGGRGENIKVVGKNILRGKGISVPLLKYLGEREIIGVYICMYKSAAFFSIFEQKLNKIPFNNT